jgi:hypothetical protein
MKTKREGEKDENQKSDCRSIFGNGRFFRVVTPGDVADQGTCGRSIEGAGVEIF